MVTSTTNGTKIGTFFSGKQYEIPQFQRDYSWKKDQIQEFWEDAWDVHIDHVEDYFFGPMVLIKTSTHEPLKIVDGQQRTITLTILMILIRDICRSLGNEPDATRIEAFLQFSKISSTESQPTLRLNQNNNNYFVENIFPYADPEEKVNYLKPPLKTNEHILDAYKILYKNIKTSTLNLKDSKSVGSFLQTILDTFEVMEITVSDEHHAYRIFATLNQRGLDLSIADLVKNYLLEMGGKLNMITNHDRWQDIMRILENAKPSEFIRHAWMAHHGYVSKQKLYEIITKTIKTSTDVSDFLKLLYDDSLIYKEFYEPTAALWGTDENVADVSDLFELLKNDSAPPLFLIAHREWDLKDFQELANICLNIHFRAKTIGNRNASDMVRAFVSSATKIREQSATLEDVKENLKKIDYPNKIFRNDISTRDHKPLIAKYLLRNIEVKRLTSHPIVFLKDVATLEHILPQTMNDDWKKIFSDDEHKQFVHRIGNLTLLHGISNSKLQNKNFDEKKELYKSAEDIKITSELSGTAKWTSETIETRSELFAGDAEQIWISLVD